MTFPSQSALAQKASCLRRSYGLTLGNLGPLIEERHMVWLEKNVPEGMTVAEFLVQGLLDDAIAEGEE